MLVAANYRVGLFGFFAFPAPEKEHPNEPKGNYDYMDEIAAFLWVKQNIAAFGGGPNNVTIFGFSAEGVSVHGLVVWPNDLYPQDSELLASAESQMIQLLPQLAQGTDTPELRHSFQQQERSCTEQSGTVLDLIRKHSKKVQIPLGTGMRALIEECLICSSSFLL